MSGITRTGAQAWALLAALAAIFVWFQMRMMDGWTIVDRGPSTPLSIYLSVLVLTTLTETLIAATGAGLGCKRRIERDGRDYAIEPRANLNERVFMIVAVNALVWQLMGVGVFPDHGPALFDLKSASAMFFWLFAILFGGEIVKRASTVLVYRFGAVRG